jgi:glutaredoxin
MNFITKLLFGKSKKDKSQPADFILYYRKLCQDCDKVKSFMEKNKVSFNYIDCELKDATPPVPIIATPALFNKEDELIAYGVDIIQYLEKHNR